VKRTGVLNNQETYFIFLFVKQTEDRQTVAPVEVPPLLKNYIAAGLHLVLVLYKCLA
jgi:hypothetical protein